jgi:hydroxypyruvate isomerase
MPRFAANLGFMFADRPHLQRIADAAKCGFAAIELHGPYEVPVAELKAAVDRAKLITLCINAVVGDTGRGDNGLTAVPGREADAAQAFDLSLSYAAALGIPNLHCVANGVNVACDERTYVKNLVAFADKAANAGKTVLIETMNSRDRPGYLLKTIEQAADIVGKVGRANVKIMFDCYHLQVESGDVITRYERYRELVGHVQIAAVPSRAEPDEGELDYPEILKAFERLGYKGWVGAEYKPRGKTEDGLGWLKAYE